MESNELQLKPIGVFNSVARYPYDVPRQGAVAGDNVGTYVIAKKLHLIDQD